MHLTLLLAWRNLSYQPWRTLASVFGIGLGIATVVAVLVIDHNTLMSQQARRNPEDPSADLLIQPDLRQAENFDKLVRDLRSEPLLSGVAPFATGKFLARGGERSMGVEVMAIDAAALTAHEGYTLAEGPGLDFDEGGPQVMITPNVAAQLSLAVGDLVDVRAPARKRAPVSTCIDGELTTLVAPRVSASEELPITQFRVVGILEATRLGFVKNRVLVSIESGRELLGRSFSPRFWSDFDRAKTDFPSLVRRFSDRYVITAPKRALAGLAPEEKAFRSGVRLAGFLALLLGLYIIFNTMSMSLVERVRSLGLLRSLGLTNGKLLGVFVVEGLALSAAGAGLALGMAWGLVELMASMKITTLGFGRPLEIREVPYEAVAGVVALGVVFCLLGVLYPFLRASRLSVIDALRRGVIELSRDPFTGVRRTVLLGVLLAVVLAWFVGAPPEDFVPEALYRAILLSFGLIMGAITLLLLLPNLLTRSVGGLLSLIPGPGATLARASLTASRHRVFGSVSGLMLAFTAIFLVLSVLESLKSETRDFGRVAMGERLYLKTTSVGSESISTLRGLAPEFAPLVALNAEVTSSFLVRGLPSSVFARGPLAGDEELRRAFAAERTILISTRCAEDLEKGPGDMVRLATRSAAGLEDYRILAVSDAYGFAPDDRVFGIISTRNMRQDWCLDTEGFGDYFVAWAPGLTSTRAEELRALAAETLGADQLTAFNRGEEITAAYIADLDLDFAIFYAILGLTILLAAVGILNAMVIAVLERRREIGLLRAVGLTAGQVATMLLAEALIVGLLGGIFGLALGIPLAYQTLAALTSVSNLTLPFVLTPLTLGAVFGGALVVSLLAVSLPALRARNLKVSNVLRYE